MQINYLHFIFSGPRDRDYADDEKPRRPIRDKNKAVKSTI